MKRSYFLEGTIRGIIPFSSVRQKQNQKKRNNA